MENVLLGCVYKGAGCPQNPDGSPARKNSRCTTYLWAAIQDTMGQTLFAAPQGIESQDGLIYSQFNVLIKTPFDTTKVYIFDDKSLEDLALDPGCTRLLQQEGGEITFSKGVCEFGYSISTARNELTQIWSTINGTHMASERNTGIR